MRIIEGRVIWSASDLKAAAECEFAWSRAIDAKLGRVPAVADPEDATLARAAALGDVHEHRVLERYRTQLGDSRDGGPGVVELPKASSADPAAMAQVVAETGAALRSDASVVFQAAFQTEEFVGFADFLRREDDGRWRVQDTKLARKARVTALMQLAAYVDQLDLLGIPRSDEVDLILGDDTVSTHRVDDILPLFRVRRSRLRALIADRRPQDAEAGEPLAWGDDRGDLAVVACGRCPSCEEEVERTRDLLLVGRMRMTQRDTLRRGGIRTIDELAAADHAPEKMSDDAFFALRAQARLQVADGVAPADGIPGFEVISAAAVGALPVPDRGDIFFDFEGDPLYTEEKASFSGTARWGLDYLFGWVDDSEQYSALWAHDFAGERQALQDFLEFVRLRRAAHPGMHIYHYAPYETTHLQAMAQRHGVGEADVDGLLRDGVFVDLYPIVLRTVRVATRSYSIKKLEPLYMGEDVRTSDVQKGDDSIVKYVESRALDADGHAAQAQAILTDLADYNRYDCVSTRRLRQWLIGIAREGGVRPSPPDVHDEHAYEPAPEAVSLLGLAETAEDEHARQTYRVAAAAIDYYPREAKTFWQGHFLRLREPLSLWESARDVFRVDAERSTVEEPWGVEDGRRALTRLVRLRGELAPGSTMGEGASPWMVYPAPAPFPAEPIPRGIHIAHTGDIVETGDDSILVRERAVGGETWDELPLALAPPSPPRALSQQDAIVDWARGLISAHPAFPNDAASDILRRIPPRTRSGRVFDGGGDRIDAIVRGVLDLDDSYLAVQGPPGTGKTFTGAKVIARLVREHGFRVGVVAQSHAIVETLLERLVADGLPASSVAKAPKAFDEDRPPGYTVIRKDGMAGFLAEHPDGAVVGGTAWDFSNTRRVDRRGLDLLVVDEAGQFSLASTIAVSVAARRVLLLGDPQQLPQVSQGSHPEPVDTSALGWVMGEEEVLRPDYGIFLSRSWRMHPAVADPVSRLAYAGALESAPEAGRRRLAGAEPGLHVVPVRHRGNSTSSIEEAAEVVRLVSSLIGSSFEDEDEGRSLPPRPLQPSDIIVVAPYNAHRQLVADELAVAGFSGVPVGTVDNFQGKEAVVSIVTLAASSGRDAPRGPEFLLLQNRLNVAISRAMVRSYLLYSPALLDDLPYTPEGVARLSAFIRLVGLADDA